MKICCLLLTIIMISAGTYAQRKCFVYISNEYEKSLNESELVDIIRNCKVAVKYISQSNPAVIHQMRKNLSIWRDAYHFSFLSRYISRSVERYCKDNNIYFWDMNFHKDLELISLNSKVACDSTYVKVAQLLADTTTHKNVAIIRATTSKCRYEIAQQIYEYLNSVVHLQRSHNFLHDHYNATMFDIKNYKDINQLLPIIYELMLKKISVIVLLIPPEATLTLWEISDLFTLNRNDHLWMTFETINHIGYSQHIPWQFIDIQADNIVNSVYNIRSIVLRLLTIADTMLVNSTTDGIKIKPEASISQARTPTSEVAHMTHVRNVSIFTRDPKQTDRLVFARVLVLRNNESLEIVHNFEYLARLIRTARPTKKLKIVSLLEEPFTAIARHLYNKESTPPCMRGSLLCYEAVIGLPRSHGRKWEETCCVGMMIDLLMKIAADLFFDYDVYLVEDGYYGSRNNVNGTLQWNGLVRDIYKQNADIAFAPITPTEERSRFVDFTEPYMETDISLIASNIAPPISFINWEFIMPLEENLRIWLIVTFAIGTVLIYVLENQVLVLKRITDKSAYARYQWREGFSYFSGLTFQRDLGGKNPKKAGARVTAIAFAFGMVIIMTTYTAVLTASKVSQENSNVFVGFSDTKITNPTYEFPYASIAHTSMEDFFRDSPDPTHRLMYTFMRQYSVNSTSEGIELVTKKVFGAFIAETPFLLHQQSFNCTLKIFGKAIKQSGYALMIPKGSPWKHLLSETILKLKLDEKIDDIQKKWFPQTCLLNASVTPAYESVEINYFGGLILVLCSFFVISFGLLGLEYFCYRHHRRVINPIQDKVQVWRETRAAERRNALIDPRDVSMLQKRIKENRIEVESDVDSVISEGEEELIRMRMRMTHQRKSKVNQISYQSDTISFATTTSSIASTVSSQLRHRSTAERLEIDIPKLRILDDIVSETMHCQMSDDENDKVFSDNDESVTKITINSNTISDEDETSFVEDSKSTNSLQSQTQNQNNDILDYENETDSSNNIKKELKVDVLKIKVSGASSSVNLKTWQIDDQKTEWNRKFSLDSQLKLSTNNNNNVVITKEMLQQMIDNNATRKNMKPKAVNGLNHFLYKPEMTSAYKTCVIDIDNEQFC